MKQLLILLLLLISNILPAQRDPQWLMPLYFQDANGDRDTVYFGYDPEASIYSSDADEFLGEEWIEIDTSQFNIYLWSYPNTPGGIIYLHTKTVRKKDIRCSFIGTYIGFCKGKLPVTMKWVDSLLYAPSCPYPDLSPRPRARIDLTCEQYDGGYNSCNEADGPPLTLTDYPAAEFYDPIMDSMIFDGSGLYPPSEVIFSTTLKLVPHNHLYVSLNHQGKESLKIFPVPFTEQLTIKGIPGGSISIKVLSATGNTLYSIQANELEITINLADFKKGFYIIMIQSESGNFFQKIIKTE
jgi:hypothetical protein